MSPSPSALKFDSVPSLVSTIWDEDKLFERLVNALLRFLTADKVKLVHLLYIAINTHFMQAEDVLEYGLVVLWEMLENEGTLLEGREADVFSFLLRIRYCNQVNVCPDPDQATV